MTIRTKKISNWWLIGLLLLGLAGVAAGTFVDLPLDQAIFSPDAFWAKLFAAFAPVPVFWGLSAAGFLGIDLYRQKKYGFLAWLFAFCLCILGPVYMAKSIQEELSCGWLISWISGLLGSVLPGLLYYLLMRKASDHDKKICLWILLIVCLGSLAIVQVVKRIWLRPRYLVVFINSVPFHDWYHPGRAAAQDFAEIYEANHDLFRSFPSGHMQSVACLYLWALIPVFRQKGSTSVLMLLATLVSAATMLSRMVLGAHFLSDVCAGFLVTFLLFAICVWSFHLAGASHYDDDEDEEFQEDSEDEAEEMPKPSAAINSFI